MNTWTENLGSKMALRCASFATFTSTVVNLSPEALIYQGFLALFLYKKMKYFIKIT